MPDDSQPLHINALTKSYGARRVLNGITLDMPSPCCLGLLGPNGAGKTTLIRTLTGRIRADSGEIKIFGRPPQDARQMIGWVPQDLALWPELTAQENLETFAAYYGLSGQTAHHAVQQALIWADLTDRAKAPVKTLSGGMKRRLNLAAGTMHQPALILLDEPTVGVDPQSRNRIFDMLETLKARGTSLIYTTHYMEEAERLCDDIAIQDHGKILARGSKDALIRESFGDSQLAEIQIRDANADALARWAGENAGKLSPPDTVRFSLPRPEDMAPLLTSARAAGFKISNLRLSRPSLETVFLQLTGRKLRD